MSNETENETVEEEEVSAEIKAKQKRLDTLHDRNEGLARQLQGQNVGINPAAVMHMRLALLLDFILPLEARLDYEIQSAENMYNMMMEIQAQARTNQLIVPQATVPKDLLV